MTPPATPKVFISSTLEDLADYREKATAAILRAGMHPIDCRYWAAGGNPPLATCLERVDDASVLIVIVAHRHGWTPPDQHDARGCSITRLECERATVRNIEVIPFFVDEIVKWDQELLERSRIFKAAPEELAKVVDDVNRCEAALREFKTWLGEHRTRKLFDSPAALETEVLHALTEWAERNGIDGSRASAESERSSYLDWLCRHCETVELLGLHLKESQNVRLGQIYVPAVTAARPEEAKSGRGKGKKKTKKPEIQLKERDRLELLLHRITEESLYVPGKPGAGKSTFCRWVALAVASGGLPEHPIAVDVRFEEKLPDTLRERFPVLCRLREWSDHASCIAGKGSWLRAQLEASLAQWLDIARPGGLTG